jgi:hypothetical protein
MYSQWIGAFCQKFNKPYSYFGRGNTVATTHLNFTACGSNYFAGDLYIHNNSSNFTYTDGLSVSASDSPPGPVTNPPRR